MLARDAEFSDVVAGPMQLIIQLADTVRVPQDAELGPIPSWNEAVIDVVGDDQTIGVVGRRLRYLVAAVEEIVFSDIPDEQHVESVWRLHRAAYFGLEIAARGCEGNRRARLYVCGNRASEQTSLGKRYRAVRRRWYTV